MVRQWCVQGSLVCGLSLMAGFAQAQQPVAQTDLAVNLAPGSMASITLEGVSGPITRLVPVDLGFFRIETEHQGLCSSIPTSGCTATLHYIKLVFGSLMGVELVDDGGNEFGVVDMVEPTVFQFGPLGLVRNGTAFTLPADTPSIANSNLFGNLDTVDLEGGLLSRGGKVPAGIQFDFRSVPEMIFTFEGTFPFNSSYNGHTVEGSITLLASGQAPFINAPPRAFIGEPIEGACGEPVTLDGTQSSDPNGVDDIVAYRWYDDVGTLIAEGAVAEVVLPGGENLITLEVQDAFGAFHRDTVTVNVEAAGPPVFTFVPGPVSADTCGAIEIGQALAESACGDEAAVTNDAPASFPGGVTVVTWTAAADGFTATETQTVVAQLGDNPACCPAGANPIVGDSNNNTLNGTPGPDCILGLGGQDQIFGQGGDDIISAGDGDDQVFGGPGSDVISGGSGQDNVFGEGGDDYVSGGDGDDNVYGAAGNDTLFGGQGQDDLFGGPGADYCSGDSGDDDLFGEDGDDVLDGGEHNDHCTGGNGFDTALSCDPLDVMESFGEPPFEGDPDYQVCDCRPSKCNDCSSGVATCESTPGCVAIIECIQMTPNCNLPHECSATCESGHSPDAINNARNLASCFGGCE